MPGLMNGHSELAALTEKLEGFRHSDAQRDELVNQLIADYQKLRSDYQLKCSDYDNEVESRRRWQDNARRAEEDLAIAKRVYECAPFALALIDGDGALFHDILLKNGKAGGSDAAHKLHTAIKEHIESRYEGASGWSIMVNIYANLDGLASKLCSVGILKAKSDLHAFTQAFTFNQPLFNFIDVGSGKERADHKIREMLRLFMSNHQCKHILFGGCHDNGYLPNLDSHKHDEDTLSRITLLETTPVTPDFTRLGFTITNFPSVFRDSSLPEKPAPLSTSSSGISSASLGSPPLSRSQSAVPQTPSVTSVSVASQSPKSTHPLPAAVSTSASSSWAAVGKSGAVSKYTLVSKKQNPRYIVFLNSNDERVDQPLQPPSREANESLHARIAKRKLCNAWHLRGGCDYDKDTCPYAHNPPTTESEKLALKHKARKMCCPQRSRCRDMKCFFGHHCSFGKVCQRLDCPFREIHDLDTKPAIKVFEDGSSETIQGTGSL